MGINLITKNSKKRIKNMTTKTNKTSKARKIPASLAIASPLPYLGVKSSCLRANAQGWRKTQRLAMAEFKRDMKIRRLESAKLAAELEAEFESPLNQL
jgi:hypothetical protein